MKKILPYVAATALLSSCVIGGTDKTACPENTIDTVYTKCPELDSLSWKFSFNTKAAMTKFKAEIEEKLSALMEINATAADTDQIIKVSYFPTQQINIQDTSNYIVLDDSASVEDSTAVELVSFDSTATISIFSPLPYHYSPFRVLAIDTSLSNLKAQRMGNITTVSFRPTAMGSSNSIDIIELWNTYLSKNPASAKAIFGNLEGLAEAAQGSAQSIRGLSPSSMNAIAITTSFTEGDILKEELLLLPGMPGLFTEEGTLDKISYTLQGTSSKPHVKKATVSYKENIDPVISHSMKKSDAVVVYKKSNINDIKRRSSAQCIVPVDKLNFFLALNKNLSEELREQISSKVTPLKLLNQLDVEGETIERITQKEESVPYNFGGNVFTPSSSELTLLYPTDNPIAGEVAAALAYTLNSAGIKVQVILDEKLYEQKLFDETYDIALGAINESLTRIPKIDSYIANYWFSGESNEIKRIASFQEVPLFAVTLFLAMQDNIQIFNNEIKQIYRK